jgi:hypothetical protein
MEEENEDSPLGILSLAVFVGLLAACGVLFFVLTMLSVVTWSVL